MGYTALTWCFLFSISTHIMHHTRHYILELLLIALDSNVHVSNWFPYPLSWLTRVLILILLQLPLIFLAHKKSPSVVVEINHFASCDTHTTEQRNAQPAWSLEMLCTLLPDHTAKSVHLCSTLQCLILLPFYSLLTTILQFNDGIVSCRGTSDSIQA